MGTHQPTGKKPVTQQDIADYLGVSKATVSCALSGKRKIVSQVLMDRIRAVADELGYDPSVYQAARRLSLMGSKQQVSNHTVAFFGPSLKLMFSTNYFSNLLQGLSDTLMEERFALVMVQPIKMTGTYHAYHPLPLIFSHGDVDGAIVHTDPRVFSSALQTLRNDPGFTNRPVVSLIYPIPGCSSVCADDLGGGYACVDHLLRLGHRRILHFEGRNTTTFPHRQRLEGYRQACHAHHKNPQKVLTAVSWRNDEWTQEETLLPEVLRQHPDITAILALHDYEACRLMRILTGLGVRVPEDISLIGFDDTEFIADAQGNNMLTTVRVPLEEIGRQAVHILLAHVEGRTTQEETVVLQTALIERGSTGLPRQGLLSF
jgi:LacI family transcriptional regulator